MSRFSSEFIDSDLLIKSIFGFFFALETNKKGRIRVMQAGGQKRIHSLQRGFSPLSTKRKKIRKTSRRKISLNLRRFLHYHSFFYHYLSGSLNKKSLNSD